MKSGRGRTDSTAAVGVRRGYWPHERTQIFLWHRLLLANQREIGCIEGHYSFLNMEELIMLVSEFPELHNSALALYKDNQKKTSVGIMFPPSYGDVCFSPWPLLYIYMFIYRDLQVSMCCGLLGRLYQCYDAHQSICLSSQPRLLFKKLCFPGESFRQVCSSQRCCHMAAWKTLYYFITFIQFANPVEWKQHNTSWSYLTWIHGQKKEWITFKFMLTVEFLMLAPPTRSSHRLYIVMT